MHYILHLQQEKNRESMKNSTKICFNFDKFV